MIRKRIALCLFLISAAAIHQHAKNRTPDPRTFCDEPPAGTDRAQCLTLIDMAMSAGW